MRGIHERYTVYKKDLNPFKEQLQQRISLLDETITGLCEEIEAKNIRLEAQTLKFNTELHQKEALALKLAVKNARVVSQYEEQKQMLSILQTKYNTLEKRLALELDIPPGAVKAIKLIYIFIYILKLYCG